MFCSLEDLTTALQEWIKLWNDTARPFKWTKTPDQIIDSICRYCEVQAASSRGVTVTSRPRASSWRMWPRILRLASECLA